MMPNSIEKNKGTFFPKPSKESLSSDIEEIEKVEALPEPNYFFEHKEITAKTNQEAANFLIEDITRNYRLAFEQLIENYSAGHQY